MEAGKKQKKPGVEKPMLLPVEATPEFKSWVQQHLERHSWSMREASMKAQLSPGRLGQIMNGERPGVEACIKLANLFNQSPAYALYLAGYLDRDPGKGVPAELEPIIKNLESIKGTPYYEPVMRAIQQVLDIALYKLDAPSP